MKTFVFTALLMTSVIAFSDELTSTEIVELVRQKIQSIEDYERRDGVLFAMAHFKELSAGERLSLAPALFSIAEEQVRKKNVEYISLIEDLGKIPEFNSRAYSLLFQVFRGDFGYDSISRGYVLNILLVRSASTYQNHINSEFEQILKDIASDRREPDDFRHTAAQSLQKIKKPVTEKPKLKRARPHPKPLPLSQTVQNSCRFKGNLDEHIGDLSKKGHDLRMLIDQFFKNNEVRPEFAKPEPSVFFLWEWQNPQPQEGINAEKLALSISYDLYRIRENLIALERARKREDRYTQHLFWHSLFKEAQRKNPELSKKIENLNPDHHLGRKSADQVLDFIKKELK